MTLMTTIDADKCRGHGRCYSLAPAVYTDDDEGYGSVVNGEVPQAMIADAESAARSCPEFAVRLFER